MPWRAFRDMMIILVLIARTVRRASQMTSRFKEVSEQKSRIQLDSPFRAGIHPDWLEITQTIGETIEETDGVTVGEATVDGQRLEKQTKTVLRLVGYHGVGAARK